jgi:hypothetical protein
MAKITLSSMMIAAPERSAATSLSSGLDGGERSARTSGT